MFDVSLPGLTGNVCKGREHLEQIILRYRAVFGCDNPIFWYRSVERCTDGETAYFIGKEDIRKAEYPRCGFDGEKGWVTGLELSPRIDSIPEQQILSELGAAGPYGQFDRDRAFIRGLITLRHPTLAVSLSEFIAHHRPFDIWNYRYPDVSEPSEVLSERVLYGRDLIPSAGDLFNTFVESLGGTPLPDEYRRMLDDRLPYEP